jgi:hypothetical protein
VDADVDGMWWKPCLEGSWHLSWVLYCPCFDGSYRQMLVDKKVKTVLSKDTA